MKTAEKNATATLADKIYKNVKMGTDSIINLLPKVSDSNLKTEMTAWLNGYEGYATRAKKLAHEQGEEAKEENIITKMSAKMGMAMNTMTDSASSHIAEMIIQGATMGVTDMLKEISKYEKEECDSRAIELAREVVEFEQDNIEKMKKYL